jgi:hypothetical protein
MNSFVIESFLDKYVIFHNHHNTAMIHRAWVEDAERDSYETNL